MQQTYRFSYSSVALRLAEVLRSQPLTALLYEWEERGDPAGWPKPPELRAAVARRTRASMTYSLLHSSATSVSGAFCCG